MLNVMTLQGRLTRDPEMRSTQSGTPVVSFTVAWSKKYKETETQLFLDCTAWRGTAELVQKYFVKGKEIVVEGELYTDKWVDKDGNNRNSIKMTVSTVHFCGSKSSDGNSSGAPSSGFAEPSNGVFAELPDVDDGDLPF